MKFVGISADPSERDQLRSGLAQQGASDQAAAVPWNVF